jgi:ubiquitin-activating enzyme E1
LGWFLLFSIGVCHFFWLIWLFFWGDFLKITGFADGGFSSLIEHTIEWSRDTFEGWFKIVPDTVNQYLSEADFVDAIRKENPNSLLGTCCGLCRGLWSGTDTLHCIESALQTARPLSLEDCVKWARLRFEQEFNHNIRQLLATFPPDSTTTSGTPFWYALGP